MYVCLAKKSKSADARTHARTHACAYAHTRAHMRTDVGNRERPTDLKASKTDDGVSVVHDAVLRVLGFTVMAG